MNRQYLRYSGVCAALTVLLIFLYYTALDSYQGEIGAILPPAVTAGVALLFLLLGLGKMEVD
ncbi:hypothetical protein L593_03355 [Salinarchaeum sp. Harcht-Bsk1]|nr:hypothetical protein L593_03355 [Salinarchaeum sp. Harcht-Bsk1]